MKKSKGFFLTIAPVLLIVSFTSLAQTVQPPAPVGPVPSPEQLAWHQMEMNAFVHFTINTLTGFKYIAEVIRGTMEAHEPCEITSLEDALAADRSARDKADILVHALAR